MTWAPGAVLDGVDIVDRRGEAVLDRHLGSANRQPGLLVQLTHAAWSAARGMHQSLELQQRGD